MTRAIPILPGTPSTHPLQHLAACSHCEDGRVSVPLLCAGQSDPDHKDWWYQLVRVSIGILLSHPRNIDLLSPPGSVPTSLVLATRMNAARSSSGSRTSPKANLTPAQLFSALARCAQSRARRARSTESASMACASSAAGMRRTLCQVYGLARRGVIVKGNRGISVSVYMVERNIIRSGPARSW